MLSGFVYAAYVVFRRLVFDNIIPGHSPIVVLVCCLTGVVLFCLGIMGEYVGRIYDEIKARPLYLVEDTVNVSRRTSVLAPSVPPRPQEVV